MTLLLMYRKINPRELANKHQWEFTIWFRDQVSTIIQLLNICLSCDNLWWTFYVNKFVLQILYLIRLEFRKLGVMVKEESICLSNLHYIMTWYDDYNRNEFRFQNKQREGNRQTQNSGIVVIVQTKRYSAICNFSSRCWSNGILWNYKGESWIRLL